MSSLCGRQGAVAVAAVAIAAACNWTSAGAPAAMTDPPYADCTAAHADGRYSIPANDPAYRPDLDLDGDGLACEPAKGRRSTR